MESFDRIPDTIILLIFNCVSDVKALIRCRAVSKRFNSLVPHTDSLLLKVDCVNSPESSDADSSLCTCLRSILNSLHNLLSPEPHPTQTLHSLRTSPSHILSGFQNIRELEIELPSGNLELEKNNVVMWRAEFGRTLRSCVIFGFREFRTSPLILEDFDITEGGFERWNGRRLMWTASALIAASKRQYWVRDVVKKQRQLQNLVLRDKEGEGILVMDNEGLRASLLSSPKFS